MLSLGERRLMRSLRMGVMVAVFGLTAAGCEESTGQRGGWVEPNAQEGDSGAGPDVPAEQGEESIVESVECQGPGFGGDGQVWSLPFPLLRQGGGDNSDIGNQQHSVMDLDGDGLVDLVVNRDVERSEQDPLVGKAHWLVFPNDGAGFGKEPREWALPFPLMRRDGPDNGSIATRAHALMDMDGDGLLDFVVNRDHERDRPDPLVGRAHWLVFRNHGDGFQREPVAWPLPFTLVPRQGPDRSDLSNQDHTLVDLDGDGLLDFVVTRDRERPSPDPLVGRNHWLVFSNTGAGFAKEPVPWRLPFPLIRRNGPDGSELANRNHALLDLDGDGLLDFVVNRDEERETEDPLVGRRHWLVFRNVGDGFDSTPEPWSLPFPLLTQQGEDHGDISTPYHSLLDLDGDGLLDLLVNRDAERGDADPLVGRAYWLLFPNDGQGFQSEPIEWSLPFALPNQEEGDRTAPMTPHHAVQDLDGDGFVDFILNRDSQREHPDPLVGRSHWLGFPSNCGG